MPRTGQCRCGLVLTFHRTAQGYKMRCPSCGAVVRLRVDRPRRTSPAAAPALPQPPAGAPPAPEEFDVELVSLSELSSSTAERPLQPRRWLLVVVVVAALLLVLGAAAWWLSG